MGFYLNYGFHPLHPLQLLDSPNQTNVESVVSFTSRLQGDFRVAKEQLQRAQQQMKQVADQHRRAVNYTEGDQVLLNTWYLRFRNCPRKLQRRFVGPFPIEQKIGKAAYKSNCRRRGQSILPFILPCCDPGDHQNGVAL